MSGDGRTRIRFAETEDAVAIASIHMMSRSATMPYLPPQKRNHEQVTDWVSDVVLKQCRTWVGVLDAEIVGYAALDGDMLEHLYLRPDVRRQGIGTLLLDEVRRHSPKGVSLTCLSGEHRSPRVLPASWVCRPRHQRWCSQHGESARHDASVDAERWAH